MSAERPFLKKTFAQVVEDTLTELRSGRNDRVVLDDGTAGSVLRTLVEAFGRELAICYEQLEHVYEAGYLDTAAGASLDKVVDLLGVQRLQAGWIEGDVVFGRGTPAPFRVEIPARTLVSVPRRDASPPIVFETRRDAVLEAGQRQMEVAVRSLEPLGGSVEPGGLKVLNRPIAGIDTVTNPKVLQPRREPESDVELRERTRTMIRGGSTATTSALQRAVLELGLTEVEILEYPERPGVVDVVLAEKNLEDGQLEQIRDRVEARRPAGVRVHVYEATPVWVRLQARVRLEQAEGPQARAAVGAALEAMVREHVAALGVGQSVRWVKLRNLIAGHPQVADVELVENVWPLLPVQANGVAWPEGSPAEATELERLSGSQGAPDSVFIGAAERARITANGVQLTLLDPEPPVWVDVEAKHELGAEETAVRATIASILDGWLPKAALLDPFSFTYEDLRLVLQGVPNLVVGSLRAVVLHSSDGRVVILDESDPEGSVRADFRVGERIVVRGIRLRAPGGGAV